MYQQPISIDSRTLQKEILKKVQGFVWMDVACNKGFLSLWFGVEHIAQAGAYFDFFFATRFIVYTLD